MKQYNNSIKGKLFNYFKQRLRIKQSTKGWWRSDCPLCGGKFTFGIHLEQARAHCFKCLESLPPIEVLMVMENMGSLSEAYKYLRIQQEYDYYEANSRIAVKEFKPVKLPDGFKSLAQGDNTIARAARYYLAKRGFNIESLILKGVGYCDEGDYFGYIIFPYYQKGELIYYQGRIFMGNGTKMKNPADSEFGIGKSNIIYNCDALYIYNRVYIVESITNALTLGDAAGGINGKKISTNQMSQIIYSPCQMTIIILDPDAYKEAIELGLSLVNYKKVKVVKLSDNTDVNDIGKQQTLRFVKSTKWQEYMDLFRIKINMNEPSTINTYNRRGPNFIDKRGL